jgi:hypothetical protein
MATYSIGIPEVHYVHVEVDADSEAEAKEVAVKMIAEGLDDLNPEYSHTLDVSEWQVEEI